MAEAPRYLIRHPTYIEGIGMLAREGPEEYDISANIKPRNSWEPLNEAAEDAFRTRNAKVMAESHAKIKELTDEIKAQKDQGAADEELTYLTDELAKVRHDHAKLPRKLKAIPRFGPQPVYTSHELPGVDSKPPLPAVDVDLEKARAGGATEDELKALRREKLVNFLRAGGATDADIKGLVGALESGQSTKAAQVIDRIKAKAVKPPDVVVKVEPKKDEKASDQKPGRASDSE